MQKDVLAERAKRQIELVKSKRDKEIKRLTSRKEKLLSEAEQVSNRIDRANIKADKEIDWFLRYLDGLR